MRALGDFFSARNTQVIRGTVGEIMSAEELKYFFSYSRKDSELVLELAKELRAAGANLWLDQLDILAGQHWDRTVEEALKSCRGMIAVLSPDSVSSDNVMDEVSYALNKGKLVVPVLIRSCEIPLRLERLQYADFTADHEIGFSQLLKALGIEEPRQPPESEPTQEPTVQKVSFLKQSESTITEQESARAGSRSRTAKMIAAACVLALIVIVSIGAFFKSRQPKAGDVITNSIGMKLVYIPAGSFAMAPIEGRPQEVSISKGFWLGQTEVTKGQYSSVIKDSSISAEDANYPVVNVSWDEAVKFCSELSKLEGKTYRLPMEAEWEYACRAGTKTDYFFGDSDSKLADYAWFAENSDNQSHPVGQKPPNPGGLYDMHGNVWEWCSDRYDEEGGRRSLRGGSWFDDKSHLRSKERTWSDKGAQWYGFRVVCSE